MLTGTTGEFLFSLPVVMTCALVASRLVSMTFIPFLGYYLLRAPKKAEESMEERRMRGFSGFYYGVGKFAIEHRWLVFASSLVFLAFGGFVGKQLKTQFFPDDVQYLSFMDVWLPNDVPLFVTNQTAMQVENVIRATAEKYGREHPKKDGKPRQVLRSITTFEGGGGPRFWFSVTPQLQQLNYAQVIVELYEKEDTPKLIGELQAAVSQNVVGARVDVRQLQTNPVDYPVELRVTGLADVNPLEEAKDITNLRSIASKVSAILREAPKASRVRDDWGQDGFEVTLKVDPDRANLAGVTNQDVAQSSSTAMSGTGVTTLRRGDQQIPVVSRLRMEERASLSDIQNLYVYSSESNTKVPLLIGFRGRECSANVAHPAPGTFPHHFSAKLYGSGGAPERGFFGGCGTIGGTAKEFAAGLQHRGERRAGQAGTRIPKPDGGDGRIDCADFFGAGVPV